MQREAYTDYQSQHEHQLLQEQSQFPVAESTCSIFTQSSSALPQSAQLTAPSSTTGPQPSVSSVTPLTSPRDSSSANGQSMASTSPCTPRTSSRRFCREGVCAETQSLGGAADVNNIYVPPLRAPSSAVSRQVSTIIKRPIVSPRLVLNPRALSFQARATQLDPTSPVHQRPAAPRDVITGPSSSVNSAFRSTTSVAVERHFKHKESARESSYMLWPHQKVSPVY